LTPTDETVINFKELSSGAPAAVRAWFYPGEQYGREFVYPKKRAVELASQQNVPVPAEQTEAANPNLETVPLVAEMPGNKEEPITQAIQTAPPRAEEPLVAQTTPTEAALPKTASPIPLLVLGGLISLGLGLGLKLFARQR
ncbi:MAG TPA: hypothetical protein VLX11_08605, partial [Candidatus Acidoferrales bacterium]|nr:hypothetical protein [Candidatus Acidoferrales bacterium]